MAEGEWDWAGVRCHALQPRDLRALDVPGLYGLVRRGPCGERTLLFVGHGERLSEAAAHDPWTWTEARRLGFNEVHVRLQARARIDRLQLVAHVVRRAGPVLNVLEAAAPPPSAPARRVG